MQVRYAEKFYGRLRSRKLTAEQESLYSNLLPKLKLHDFSEIDMRRHNKIFLEIGFGNGDHIVELGRNNPLDLFIGCEVFVNGVGSLLSKITASDIHNIRIFDEDVRKLLPLIPTHSIDGLFLMFPDPWPKRRHIERRFINKANVESIHRILKPKGEWRIATDHVDYAKHILKTFRECEHLFINRNSYDKLTRPPETDWPKTRYEQKSKSESFLYVVYEAK